MTATVATQEGAATLELSGEQDELRRSVAEFATRELAPHAITWDEEHHFPVDVLRHAASLGLGGVCVAEDVGGSALSRLDAVVVFEALATGCPSLAAYVSIHNMVAGMVDRFGDGDQRRRYLPALCSMEHFGSYCLTEADAGSDAAALRTTARRDGDHYVLDGVKQFVSGAGTSEVYVVMARTGGIGASGITAFLVELGTNGLSFGANEQKMGWKAQPTRQVVFDRVRIPVNARLGPEGAGFKVAMAGLDGGRLNIGACSIGGASTALARARTHLLAWQAFGRPLADQQALRFQLADMATELEASRLMIRRVACALDAGSQDATRWCAMAKRFATDAGFLVANQALQLHGGYGYLAEAGIEKIVRDLRVHQILEGTNEIMRLIISRELLPGCASMTTVSDSAVLVAVEGHAGHITLNRPDTLNALTLEMIRLIDAALDRFEPVDSITTVIIDGASERALCAGGDIRSLYEAALVGDPSPRKFWEEEYCLDARIAHYGKPIVVIMNGIVMGGGVGISAHASHRVVTEHSVVAMPEVGIGFAPDVGGTWLLSHAPGELGTHVALTAGRLSAADAIACGLADRFVAAQKLPALYVALGLVDADRAVASAASDPPIGGLVRQRRWIDQCYAADSAEEIVARLRAQGGAASVAADEVASKSPTAIKVTLRALRQARQLPSLQHCLEMEYRISTTFLDTTDFIEGVRAAVIDKDRSPLWNPARLEDVGDIDRFFAPRSDDLRLSAVESAR